MKKLSIVILLALITSSEAWACSCDFKTLEERAIKADAIYFATLQQGRLIAGEYDKRWPAVQGTFNVRKTLKGAAPPGPMVLMTPGSGPACGVSMVVAETYLIFKKNGQNHIISCDGSTIIDRLQEDEVAARVKKAISTKTIASSRK